MEHFMLFIHHFSHGLDLGLCGSLRLVQVVAQTVALVIFHVGCVFFVFVITFVIDFIILQYRGSLGENRGYSAEMRL